eukprot:scaffold25467_cov112-Isochrysis_galbana.AAC.3
MAGSRGAHMIGVRNFHSKLTACQLALGLASRCRSSSGVARIPPRVGRTRPARAGRLRLFLVLSLRWNPVVPPQLRKRGRRDLHNLASMSTTYTAHTWLTLHAYTMHAYTMRTVHTCACTRALVSRPTRRRPQKISLTSPILVFSPPCSSNL